MCVMRVAWNEIFLGFLGKKCAHRRNKPVSEFTASTRYNLPPTHKHKLKKYNNKK